MLPEIGYNPTVAVARLTRRLRVACAQIEVGETDGVRQLRVAVRRMGAVLRPFRELPTLATVNKSLRALKRVAKCCGSLRDIDVQLDLIAVYAPRPNGALRAWRNAQLASRDLQWHQLRQRLANGVVLQAARKLERVCTSECAVHKRKTAATMCAATAALKARELQLQMRLIAVLQRTEDPLAEPARWHRVRLDCKRLRYLTECFDLPVEIDPLVACAKKTQAALGALRDHELLQHALLDANVHAPSVEKRLRTAQRRFSDLARLSLSKLAAALANAEQTRAQTAIKRRLDGTQRAVPRATARR